MQAIWLTASMTCNDPPPPFFLEGEPEALCEIFSSFLSIIWGGAFSRNRPGRRTARSAKEKKMHGGANAASLRPPRARFQTLSDFLVGDEGVRPSPRAPSGAARRLPSRRPPHSPNRRTFCSNRSFAGETGSGGKVLSVT